MLAYDYYAFHAAKYLEGKKAQGSHVHHKSEAYVIVSNLNTSDIKCIDGKRTRSLMAI